LIAVVSTAQALVLDAGTLVIDSGGILDLENNNLIVRTGAVGTWNGTNYTGIQGYVQTGLYNGANGYWDGPGINSSTAANHPNTLTAVGVLDNALAGYTDWPPLEPVAGLSGTEILVKYTWWGDSDLNGIIDAIDYSLIDGGFGAQLKDWVNGDYSYDGVIDAIDYSLIDAAFGGQTGPLSPAGAAQAVPEPNAIVLASLGLLALVGRRRKLS
jgi:hypothetical protein